MFPVFTRRFLSSTSSSSKKKFSNDEKSRIRDVLMAIPILAAVQSFVIGVDVLPSTEASSFPLDHKRECDRFDTPLTRRLYRTTLAYISNDQTPKVHEGATWFRRLCLVDKAKYRLQRISASSFTIGELVLYHSPIHEDNRKLVGRVIARPHDRIKPRNTDLYGEWRCKVPAGSVWIESLHQNNEELLIDSNIIGPVPIGLIYGRVLAVPFESDIKTTPEISIEQLRRVSYRGI